MKREKTVPFYKRLICIGLTSILEALTLQVNRNQLDSMRGGMCGGEGEKGARKGSKARLMRRVGTGGTLLITTLQVLKIRFVIN